MKLRILTLQVVFLSLSVVSSLTAQQIYRFLDETTGKWGVRDAEWNIILAPEYDEVEPRPDTLFIAKKAGKVGAFDERGEVRIPLIYQHILPHLNPFRTQYGYAAVTKDKAIRNSWGMVDSWGKIILPEKFQYVRAISSDLLVGKTAQDTLLQFFNGQGEPVFQKVGTVVLPPYHGFADTSFLIEGVDRVTRYYQLNGTAVFPADPATGMWTDGELLIVRQRGAGDFDPEGVIDTAGQVVIPFQLGAIRPGLPGQFIVADRADDYELLGKGVYDGGGKVIIPIGKYDITIWEGVYLLRDLEKDRTGITARDGLEILPREYIFKGTWTPANFTNRKEAHPRRYFTAKVSNPPGQILIQKNGTLLRCDSARSVQYFSDTYPLLLQMLPQEQGQNGKVKLIDFVGNEVLPAGYESLQFTTDPAVWYGRKAYGQPAGFIDVSAPEESEFKYRTINQLSNRYLYGKYLDNRSAYDLFTPAGEFLCSGEYLLLDSPGREHYEAFRHHYPARKIIARALREGMEAGDWLAIDDTGQAFLMKKAEVPTPPAKQPEQDADVFSVPAEEFAGGKTPAAAAELETVAGEQSPRFPGGEAALQVFLTQNLRYPTIAEENGIAGTVMVSFIVQADGSITRPQIVQNIGNGCGQEALRLVKTMPKWEPAQEAGEAVRRKYLLPIRFQLN